MSLIQSLLTEDRYGIKCPYQMQPIGICIHNTANDASAQNEISYMKTNNNEVSFHVAVDDKEAIQGISFDRNAWHSGDGGSGTGNRKYIAVEICYSKSGGERFIQAENRAVKEVAALLKKYGWGIDRVKAHREFSAKNCPHRTNMNSFKSMVQKELNNLNGSGKPSGAISSNPAVNETIKGLQSALNSAFITDKNGQRLDEDGSLGTLTKSAMGKVALGKGSKGALVKWVQNRLLAKGYKLPRFGADSDFGNETGNAVEAFQRDHNLTTDRIAGFNTISELLK